MSLNADHTASLALDVRHAAALLGLSEKATRARVARRLIPFRKLGGRVVFLRIELEAWLSSLPGCTATEARANVEQRQA